MVRAGMLGENPVIIAEFFGEENVSVSRHVLSLRFGSNICLEDSTRGSIVHDPKGIGCRFDLCGYGAISWELKVVKTADFHFGFAAGKLARLLHIAGMYWDIAGLKAQFDGRITVGDREFKVESTSSFGYQDKTWGSRFSKEWLKLYGGRLMFTNGQEVPDGSLLVARGEPVLWGYPLGVKYFIVLHYNGKVYNFSSVLSGKNYFYKYNEYLSGEFLNVEIEAVKLNYRIICKIMLKKESLVTLNYPTPQSANFPVYMSSAAEVSVELYRSAPLLAWELAAQFKLSDAAFQVNHMPEPPAAIPKDPHNNETE
jgi:tocopherol cyclase